MTDKKTFGLFIKQKRTEKNYSQKDLAQMLFVTEWAVSKWERGVSYPDITLISDICRVLDISEHELITASTDTDARKMRQEARTFRVISGAWFWVPTISYAIALVICFICNLAVNHTLSWFFIVLSSLICAYSFIPTFTSFFKSKKPLVFTATSYISICLLLFTCAAYTGTLYWFPTACIGILMGYVLLFLPILLSDSKLSRYRFILSFTIVFALTLMLLLCVRIHNPFRLMPAILITCYGFTPAILCTIICMFRFDAFIKAGICISLCTVMYYFAEYVTDILFGTNGGSYLVNFNNWQQYTEGNVYFISLISLLLISVIFTGVGILRICRKNDR